MGYRAGLGKLRKLEDLRGVAEVLFTMATRSFKWDGLYDDLPGWLLERYLFDCGRAAAFEDPDLGFMILPAWPTGPLDMQYNYSRYLAVGLGYQREIDRDDCVIIYNNGAHAGSWQMVRNYTTAIDEVNLTDRLNIKQLRFPWIFQGDEETITSLKAAIKQVEDNTFALFTNRTIGQELQRAIDSRTEIKYLGEDLKKHRDDLFNECLTLLGFDNVPITKKERLITDEAQANTEQVQFFRKDRLRARADAIQEINSRFGQNITVEWIGGDFKWSDATSRISGREMGQSIQ